jgi:hypothetical protein
MSVQSLTLYTKSCLSSVRLWLSVNLNRKTRYRSIEQVKVIFEETNAEYMIAYQDDKYWLVYKKNNTILTRGFNLYRDHEGGFIKNHGGIKYRTLSWFIDDSFSS